MSAKAIVNQLLEDDVDAKDFSMSHLPDAFENALAWAVATLDEGVENSHILSHEDASERVLFIAKAALKMYNILDGDNLSEIERRLYMHVDKLFPA